MSKHILGVIFFLLLSIRIFSQADISTWGQERGINVQWDAVLTQAHLLTNFGRVILDFSGRWAWGPEGSLRRFSYEEGELGERILSSDTLAWIEEQLLPTRVGRIGAIIIDPGHGGRDPGAQGRIMVQGEEIILSEKNIVLDVSLRLGAMLENTYPSKNIVFTRSGDSFPSLDDRVAMAHAQELEEGESIIFISIHVNASFNTRANGFEIWHIPSDYQRQVVEANEISAGQTGILPILNNLIDREYRNESISIAQILSSSMETTLGPEVMNRGLKEEAWFVVRKARMPAVLVELGFLTNEEEAQKLNTESYLMKLSEALYNGIQDYITAYEEPQTNEQ